MIGGTPTANDMMIPIFVPSESESQPRTCGLASEDGSVPELLPDESSTLPLVAAGGSEEVGEDAEESAGGSGEVAAAIGPTLMVVKELGCSGSS